MPYLELLAIVSYYMKKRKKYTKQKRNRW